MLSCYTRGLDYNKVKELYYSEFHTTPDRFIAHRGKFKEWWGWDEEEYKSKKEEEKKKYYIKKEDDMYTYNGFVEKKIKYYKHKSISTTNKKVRGSIMTYYKVTNCKDGSIPWVLKSKDIDFFKDVIKDLPHLVIEEITEAEFEKETAD